MEEDWYETVLGDGKFHYPKILFLDSESAVKFKIERDKKQVLIHHIRPGVIRLCNGVIECQIHHEPYDCFSDDEVLKLASERVAGAELPTKEDLSFTDDNYILPDVKSFVPEVDDLFAKLNECQQKDSLRYILIQVLIDEQFPPAPNSAREHALIKMSSTARQRKSEGCIDKFLFVLIGCCDLPTAQATIEAYGFENAQVRVVELSDLDPDGPFDDDKPESEVAHLIEMWLLKEHQGAVAFIPNEYDATQFWWSGIEKLGPSDSRSKFRNEFPEEFQRQADTWLGVLHNELSKSDLPPEEINLLYVPKVLIYEAALCEWLHGFNAACGNSYNHFDPSTVAELILNDKDLHEELENQSGCAEELYLDNDVGDDVSERSAMTLGFLTGAIRPNLRELLSKAFGGDVALLWALHSTIWPKFDRPILEAMNTLVMPVDYSDIAEVMDSWIFVREGWCDASDQ